MTLGKLIECLGSLVARGVPTDAKVYMHDDEREYEIFSEPALSEFRAATKEELDEFVKSPTAEVASMPSSEGWSISDDSDLWHRPFDFAKDERKPGTSLAVFILVDNR